MNEFLTENARRAYPLEHELPPEVPALWGRLLSDACIGTDYELGENERLSLLEIGRGGPNRVKLKIGVAGKDLCEVLVDRSCGPNAVVFGSSAHIKALLVANGEVADALLRGASTGTVTTRSVNVPFALRCASGGAQRRVESIAAYSTALCNTKRVTDWSLEDPVKTVVGGDATLTVYDGLDLDVTGMAPLEGEVLRLSAITAPAGSSESDSAVDLMLRGDECFTVEAIPGAKLEGDDVVPRSDAEGDGKGALGEGVIKIGNSCKACCQCEDYKNAVDALRSPESLMLAVKHALDDAKAKYDAAVDWFETYKSNTLDNVVNNVNNVRAWAVAAAGSPGYTGSTVAGKRARIAVTLYAENRTQKNATVEVTGFTVGDFEYKDARWTHVAGGSQTSGSGLPRRTLAPGDTLMATATYAKQAETNSVALPGGMKARISVQLDGQVSATSRDVPVTEASS